MGPIEFAVEAGIGDDHLEQRPGVLLQLIYIGAEEIKNQPIVLVDLVIRADVPLAGIMSQALGNRDSANGRQICVLQKESAQRQLSGVRGGDLGYCAEVTRRIIGRRRIFEESAGQAGGATVVAAVEESKP